MAIALVLLAMTSLPLLAQEPDRAPERSNWMTVVLALFLVVCVGAVSILSSKRGHRD